jgi:hypothetical protein
MLENKEKRVYKGVTKNVKDNTIKHFNYLNVLMNGKSEIEK